MNNCDLILHFAEKYIAEKEKNIILQQKLEQQEQMQSSAQRIARAWVKSNPAAWKFMQQFSLYLAGDSPENGK